MREIKFRAWNSEEKKMYQVDAIDWSDGVIISCHLWDGKQTRKQYPHESMGDKVEFLQYIGEKDKNGINIFEKDFLKYENDLYLIKWSEELLAIVMDRKGWMFNQPTHSMPSLSKMEIVGNVYENPELLK